MCVHEVSTNTTEPNLVRIFHSVLLPVPGKSRKFRGVEKHTNQMQLSICVLLKDFFRNQHGGYGWDKDLISPLLAPTPLIRTELFIGK